MLNRKLVLRVLLGSLAVAAVSGALAVLLGEEDLIARVAWTGVVVALACGLALWSSALYERKETREAGLLGLAVTVADFLLVLGAIWLWDFRIFGWDIEWRLLATAAILLPVALPAMLFLRMLHAERMRPAGWTGLVLAGATLLPVLAAIWLEPFLPSRQGWWDVEEKLWFTSLALGCIGLLAVMMLAGWWEDEPRWWRYVGLGAAGAGFALCFIGIWWEPESGGTAVTAALSAAAAVAQANVLRLCRLPAGQGWLRWTAIGTGVAAGGLLTLAVASGPGGDLFFGRLAAASGVITACATLAVLILARFHRPVDLSQALTQITLHCPRCQKKQTLPLGGGACGACGLSIRVQVEDANCPQCGYSLNMLRSDRCPECGTPVHPPRAASAVAGDPVEGA